MSFLDDVIDFGAKAWNSVSGSGIGAVAAGVAKSTALGFLLKQVTSSITKDNQVPTTATVNTVDPGVRLQVDPDTAHAIPVVYGTAYLGAIVTDAQLTNNNQTMYYCMTICEKTGNMINGTASVLSFDEIFIDDARATFSSDGRTVASLITEDGVVNSDIAGLITVYCYSGNSTSPVVPTGYSATTSPAAYTIMPEWTSSHTMNDLIFAIVRVDYNKDKGVTRLPNIEFKIKNTMSQPGDCLYDYMTNTRYGAGIPSEEIYSA